MPATGTRSRTDRVPVHRGNKCALRIALLLLIQERPQPRISAAADRKLLSACQHDDILIFAVRLDLRDSLQVHDVRPVNAQKTAADRARFPDWKSSVASGVSCPRCAARHNHPALPRSRAWLRESRRRESRPSRPGVPETALADARSPPTPQAAGSFPPKRSASRAATRFRSAPPRTVSEDSRPRESRRRAARIRRRPSRRRPARSVPINSSTSNPSSFGIWISRKTRSGFSSPTALTASNPLAHSATTSISGWLPRNSSSIFRASSSSSTMTALIFLPRRSCPITILLRRQTQLH